MNRVTRCMNMRQIHSQAAASSCYFNLYSITKKEVRVEIKTPTAPPGTKPKPKTQHAFFCLFFKARLLELYTKKVWKTKRNEPGTKKNTRNKQKKKDERLITAVTSTKNTHTTDNRRDSGRNLSRTHIFLKHLFTTVFSKKGERHTQQWLTLELLRPKWLTY